MAARVFLGFSALIWLPYGLFCLVQPGYLESAAGVAATSPTGVTELRAMYGGLQAAIGVLCAMGCASAHWRGHALVTLGFLAAGLGLARLAGAFAVDTFSSYTILALGLEFGSAALAWLFGRPHAGPAATA